MTIKKTVIALILLTLSLSLNLQAQNNEVVVDKVVAVVGKNIIKLSDVEGAYNQVRRQQGINNAQMYRCQILESMLLSKLLVHKGEVDSVEVSDDDVEEQVSYYLNMELRQYGSKEALRNATGRSYDELHDIYFDILKERYLAQKVEYNLTENVKVTPGEVREFFDNIPKDSLPDVEDEYELAEITIKPKVSSAERERVKLELAQLRERVLKGEKFSMLAALYSQDPGTSNKGGELGFFSRGDMVTEFESAAFALQPGEVSPIVETQYGFHIIQLIERRGNTINCRHILMIPKVSNDDLLRSRIQLDSIANQIRLGNLTFEQAAIDFSDGATRQQGGIIANAATGTNRFYRSNLKEQFPGISIATMDEGEISNATMFTTEENQQANRIVKLVRHIPAHKANMVDDYDKLYNAALNKAQQAKIQDWAQRQIRNTYIRIDDEFKDCDFQLNWFDNNNGRKTN